MGKEKKTIRFSQAPIRHETLSDDLINTSRFVWKWIGKYLPSFRAREDFELHFMRDRHPDREANIWRRICVAWMTYHSRYEIPIGNTIEERLLVLALIAISTQATPITVGVGSVTGTITAELQGMNTKTTQRLRESYETPDWSNELLS